MATSNLGELFDRFRRHGDLEALGQVFDRTAVELLGIARHLCREEAEAEDVVQATFLAAIEERANFDASRELVPWLTGILTNKAKVARALSRRVPDPKRLPEPAVHDPAVDAELRDLRSTLDRALERVPEAYRDVLRLFVRDDKDADEIARELGRPAGTVRVQIHRGLKHLRRGLPASVALSGLGIAIGPRGLAAIRAEILAEATGAATATASGAGIAATAGGMLMGKKIALTVGIALLATGLVWLGRRELDPHAGPARAPITSALALSAPNEARVAPTPNERPASTASDPESRRSAATEEPYGALDTAWVWSDGSPARGIGVGAVSYGEPQMSDSVEFGRTDANGRIAFDRLREGKILVFTTRGWAPRAPETVVTRGQRTPATFTIPDAEDVHGRVVDAEGRPVSGASVWIFENADGGGSVEATSAADGSYALRSVQRVCSLFAIADGRGSSFPTSLKDLDAEGTGRIDVDLVLRGESGSVRGSVRDPDGNPVPAARVTLHPRRSLTAGRMVEWHPMWTDSASDGSFRFDGAHAGPAELEVFARGFAVAVEDVPLQEDRTPNLVVRLERGFTVTGTVRSSDGQPIAGARVHHGPCPGQEGYVAWRHQVATRADEQGAYVLPCIPSGTVKLHAARPRAATETGESTRWTGRSGDVHEWSPVLRAELQIAGRIVDAAGRPLTGWTVDTLREGDPRGPPSRSGISDAEGAFVLAECADALYTLYAYPPRQTNAPGRIARVIEKHVPAGRDDAVLTLPYALEKEGFLVGRFVDDAGAAVRDASIEVKHLESGHGASTETFDAQGSFRLGPLPPGHYTMEGWPKDLAPIVVPGPIELSMSEEHDVGTIRVPLRGRFELALAMSDGSPVEAPWLRLDDGLYGQPVEAVEGAGFKSENLYPGTYTLVVNGARIVTMERRVEIRAGETTRLELSTIGGVSQDIQFPTPANEPPPEKLTIVVRDADGSKLFEEEVLSARKYDGTILRTFHAGFVPGRYTFEARSPDGWTSQGSFEIEDLSVSTKTIESPLHRP